MSKKFLQGLFFVGVGLTLSQVNAVDLSCQEQYTNCANSCKTRGEHHVDMICISNCLNALEVCKRDLDKPVD
ncbi:MAG: hypothetical protein K2X28_07605 [Alphaproteobacteria bacterium]|nr:hypothetical protein [Alphaproteobacteria bacterium]